MPWRVRASAGPRTIGGVCRRAPVAYGPGVIRAILHLLNDQPLTVELFDEPKPSDSAVICTNLRTNDGKRPVFIDFGD